MGWRENVIRDVAVVFLNPLEWAEEITYYWDETTTDTFDAVLFRAESEREQTPSGPGRRQTEMGLCLVPYSKVSAPSLDHWIETASGERWEVARIDDREILLGGALLSVIRRFSVERSAEDLRRT